MAWKLLAWAERYNALSTLLGGGAVVSADVLHEYGLKPYQAILIALFGLIFVQWLINLVFPRTKIIPPYKGQGAHEIWKKTYWFHRQQPIVSYRCIKATDIFKWGSLAARGKKQTYENCLILGPATFRATLDHTERVRHPYNEGGWLPAYDACVQPIEESSATTFTPLQHVFFENCDFRDVVFELKAEVITEINAKRAANIYATPSEPSK